MPVEIFGFKDELEASDPRSERVRREIDEMGQITWRPVIEIERARGAWKQFHIVSESSSIAFAQIPTYDIIALSTERGGDRELEILRDLVPRQRQYRRDGPDCETLPLVLER